MILILGGTAEARALAAQLDDGTVISSLAGRVSRPRLPRGEVRIGGFGGPDKLAAWLRENDIERVVDATHPFAARISASACTACAAAKVPLLRLERPGWTAHADDHWHWVDTLDDAARTLAEIDARRVLVTSGRQGLAAFKDDAARHFVVRCVEPPDPGTLPPDARVLLDRGPYTLDGERELMRAEDVDALVTKDSGGAHTEAKLVAARERMIPVVVVRRPPRPPAETVTTVAAALAWAQPG